MIVDWKTDAVRGGNALLERAERYRAQGELYAAAKEALGGSERRRVVLWFVTADEAVELEERAHTGLFG